MRRKAGRRWFTGELIRSSRKAEGAATVSHWSYPQGVAFTWRPYRVIGDANPTAVAWITARSSVVKIFCRGRSDPQPSTVPWRVFVRQPDRATSGKFLSIFLLTTSSSVCTKVVDQCSSYNVAITTIAKFLLNHVQICAQSSCSALSVWNIRLKMIWQPNFGSAYLQFLHNNYAHTLKQRCSHLLGLQVWCGDLRQFLTNLKVNKLQSWAYNTKIQT
jgi:hypothetical protein